MQEIIDKTISFVKATLADAEAGHDWFHIERVFHNAQKINAIEKGDALIVTLAALLHDIADPKFNNGDEEIGPLPLDREPGRHDADDRALPGVGVDCRSEHVRTTAHARLPELVAEDDDGVVALQIFAAHEGPALGRLHTERREHVR